MTSSAVSRFLIAASCAALPLTACDLFGDDPGNDPPPTALGPGAELDGSIVDLAESIRPDFEAPPEILRPDLEAALVNIGFGVRSVDGFISVNESDTQGIVFEAWDLDTMAVGLQQGLGQSLDDYVGSWAQLVPGTDAATMKTLLLADLAKAAASEAPAQRSYAQLLVALGRNSPVGYDLLDPNVDGAAPLDALQLGLLTYRLSAELWQSLRNIDGSQRTQALDGPAPCTQTNTEGLVMDASAVVSSTVWGGILGHLSDKGLAAADKFSLGTQVANAALVYAKLAWTMAVFRVDMTVTPSPLVRTLSTSEDHSSANKATISATFKLDGTGKTQILNCLRIAMNAINLDFSVPQDGPLAGKLVEWDLDGRGPDDVIESSGQVRQGQTSATGNSTLDVFGKPRPKKLTGKLVDVERRPKVRATTNIKNKDFAQDMIDISAGVGGLGALWAMPAEMLNRAPMIFAGITTVVVKDKKELIGDHFQIVGEYADPEGLEDVLAIQVTDRFVADLGVKIANDVFAGELLAWSDTKTHETDHYEATGPGGEGCIQTTTITGTTEVFTSRHKETVDGFYIPPGIPGEPSRATVYLTVPGYRMVRGYVTKTDQPSCDGFEVLPQRQGAVQIITFDSTMFTGIGTSTIIDARSSGGIGWKYTITYVE